MTTIPSKTRSAFSGLFGKQCCRQRVGEWRSLSIGFGEKVPHTDNRTADSYYGEWEIGTYSSAWRIICGDRLLCGSMNLVDFFGDLDQELQRIQLGIVCDIEALSSFDIRVKLDNEIFIDFFGMSTVEDEMFHIFGPDSLYVEFKLIDGWTVCRSDIPWK